MVDLGERIFHYRAQGSNLKTEFFAGLSTFAAMAYIICLQPAVMSGVLSGVPTGMPFGALLTTTCLVSAFGCFVMAFLGNHPIGLAPGVGSSFFTAFNILPVCALAMGVPVGTPEAWHAMLGVVLLGGVIFFWVSVTPLRGKILRSISLSQKNAIGAGIGLFIAFIGLKGAGVVVLSERSLSLGSLTDKEVLVFLAGFLVTGVLIVLKIKGAILIGMVVSALVALFFGEIRFGAVWGNPENPLPVMFKADCYSVLTHLKSLLPLVFLCFLMEMFDTTGTVLAVASRAGLLSRKGRIIRGNRVFAADAIATLGGAVGGHSSVGCYIESGAGVEVGGRTGMTALVIGCCFLLALFFSPILSVLGGYSAISSAALVTVGIMMVQAIGEIEWHDFTEAAPAFLIVAGIPFTGSIISGTALGLALYPIFKIAAGRGRELSFFTYFTAFALLGYWILFSLR